MFSDNNYLFHRDNGIFSPQRAAGSPWSETMKHGGPVNAILTMSVEEVAQDLGFQIARLTIDILKPVAMKPVGLATQLLRKGGQMAVVDAFLTVEGSDEVVASARAVLLKHLQGTEPVFDTSRAVAETRRDIASEPWIPEEVVPLLPAGMHNLIRFHPSVDKERPIYWINANVGMLQDRAMTPVEQCATVADMTTVIATRMCAVQEGNDNPNIMGLMNTNTTIHLSRPPEGEWFGFCDHFLQAADGYGVAECTLFDEQGCIGKVTQNLIVKA